MESSLRPPRTTPNLELPIPGDAGPADYVTDTGAICDRLDQVVAPAEAVGMTRIYDQRLAADQANINITDIPQTFAHLRLILRAVSNVTGQFINQRMRPNNLTGAQYFYQMINSAAAGAPSGFQGLAETYGELGVMAGGVSFGVTVCDLPDYASASAKSWISHSSAQISGAAGGVAYRAIAGFHGAAVAINQLMLFAASGSYGAGTRVTLYGLT